MIRRGDLPRGLFLVGAALLAAVTVVGCSPAPEPLVAVERTENGGTRLLIAPCAGYDTSYVSVLREDGPENVVESWMIVSSTRKGSPGHVDPFTAPEGWKASEATLTQLNPSGTYTAEVRGALGGRGLDGSVTFTGKELEGLGSGKVLTAVEGKRVMDRADFMKSSPGRCGS